MITNQINLTHNNLPLILRNPQISDAVMLIDFLKTVCAQTPFLLKEPEEITFSTQQEENFITSMNDSPDNLMLLCFYNGAFVGNCSLMSTGVFRQRHKRTLGIAIKKEFTGFGIGTVMLTELLKIAQQSGVEQVKLEVMVNNLKAVNLYKKLGFTTLTVIPHYMKYKDNTYTDAYLMIKSLV